MRPTPITDALEVRCVRNPGPGNGLIMAQHGRKLERLLGEARDAFRQIARNPGDCDNETGFTSGHISRDLLARIDATLDPENLEGPPRTREERAADARELDAVAPTPAEKFALMFSAGKKGIGHKIIDRIIEGSLVDVDGKNPVVFVWSAAAPEQLEALIQEELSRFLKA